MPRRQNVFITGQFYHIFNRSIDHYPLFTRKSNLKRAFSMIDFYRFKTDISYSRLQGFSDKIIGDRIMAMQMTEPLVEIHAYALMPNHFHFLVKQIQDKGINIFMANFQNGYAKYINIKYHRHGPVFSGRFKGLFIEDEELFLHISRYIHLNPVTSSLIKADDISSSPLTSFSDYINNDRKTFVKKEILASLFKNSNDHLNFVLNQADYQKHLHDIKNMLCE